MPRPDARDDAQALLALWEQALPLPPARREALLAGEPPARTLGAQRRRLLQSLQQHGGDALALRCRCPACGEWASIDTAPSALLQALPEPAPGDAHALSEGGWSLRFRLPAPDDLQALEQKADAEDFAQALLQRCVLEAVDDGRDVDVDVEALPPGLRARVSQRMEELDAAAAIDFDVACPDCGHRWAAPFDPGEALWALLQAQAEQLLLDVDTLAQRYGWREHDVLTLSPLRRQAYLQLARAE